MTDHVIDGHAVEVGTDLVPVEPAPVGLFRTSDPVEVVAQATRVADALADVIAKKQLFAVVSGKRHVLVEGWQLVGAMLGVTAVCVATEPVDGGYKAIVEARTADGRVVGRADALCTKHEKRGPWKTADDYARLSMAQTRATSKALKGPLGFVVSLAGYETTPAEEMTHAEPDAPTAPAGAVAAAANVTVEEPKPTKPVATVSQRRLIFAMAKQHNVAEDQLRHILQDVAGTAHTDRLPRDKVDAVLEAITGVPAS